MLYPCCNAAVTHNENKIYVFGGFLKDGTPIQIVQQFDIGKYYNAIKLRNTLPDTLSLNNVNVVVYVVIGFKIAFSLRYMCDTAPSTLFK